MEFHSQHALLSRSTGLLRFAFIRKVMVSRRSLGDVCFLDACVSLCVCVSNYRAENTPHSFRPRWRGAVPGSGRKQEREYFLDTGARFLDFCFCCFLWNQRGFGMERAKNTDWATAGVCGRRTQTLHRRRNEYAGYILVPRVTLPPEYTENKQCTLQQENGRSP